MAVGALAILPLRLAAQEVFGHTPESSPYHDVESPSELSLFGGYMRSKKDPAGVAPQSAPVVGAREMVHLGGPAIFIARITHAFSSRTAIDPAAPPQSRVLGNVGDGITMLDLGLGINITGDRSWHYLVPYLTAGPGVVSDLGARRDVGDYRFGTNFLVTYGGGFRWVPPGRLSIHAEANSYLWTGHYPSSYHTNIFGSQVIPVGHHLTGWRNSGIYVLGLSYPLWR